MTAIAALLDDLIDYAGMYPPANLDLHAASRNYLRYRRGEHSPALGRFILDARRVKELRSAAGSVTGEIRLSITVSQTTDLDPLLLDVGADPCIEAFELKTAEPLQIVGMARRLPPAATTYFEMPVDSHSPVALDAVRTAGARVKLRMGGLAEDAIPSIGATVKTIQWLAERRLRFKATAGLHHPLRSAHPSTNKPGDPVCMMHGFLNLFCASALIYFGGDEEAARSILNETDRDAWQVSADALICRSIRFSTRQIQEVRREFFISFGSCSFDEPIADLEAFGWL